MKGLPKSAHRVFIALYRKAWQEARQKPEGVRLSQADRERLSQPTPKPWRDTMPWIGVGERIPFTFKK